LDRLLKGSLCSALARPWFDRLALGALGRWYFPASRQWAAANAAGGELDRFLAAFGGVQAVSPHAVEAALGTVDAALDRRRTAEKAWRDALFETSRPRRATLLDIESERLAAADAHNRLRRLFFSTRLDPEPAMIGWQTPPPGEIAALFGPARTDPAGFYRLPGTLPEPEVSPAIVRNGERRYWLRLPSPSGRLGDAVTARVSEPDDARDPPTLVWGHGLCMETEHWTLLNDGVSDLTRLGFRVVAPEAPWHGRRTPRGGYGGERFVATMPLGPIDALSGAALEWAALIAWARAASRGAVAVGGISLGALTAQLVAAKAQYWPAGLRPDAMLLAGHCASLWDAEARGDLGRLWNSRASLMAAGWSEEAVAPYLVLTDPVETPVMPGEHIVSLLGRRDTVTPVASGRAQLDRWAVPEENRFLRERGHFSLALGLMRDLAPFERLAEVTVRSPSKRPRIPAC